MSAKLDVICGEVKKWFSFPNDMTVGNAAAYASRAFDVDKHYFKFLDAPEGVIVNPSASITELDGNTVELVE